jgi:hypothetical protein
MQRITTLERVLLNETPGIDINTNLALNFLCKSEIDRFKNNIENYILQIFNSFLVDRVEYFLFLSPEKISSFFGEKENTACCAPGDASKL